MRVTQNGIQTLAKESNCITNNDHTEGYGRKRTIHGTLENCTLTGYYRLTTKTVKIIIQLVKAFGFVFTQWLSLAIVKRFSVYTRLEQKSEQIIDNESQCFLVLEKEFINKEKGKPKINHMVSH